MSTKVTLNYSHGKAEDGEENIQPYHLFLDIPELDTVFLRLDGVHCDHCDKHGGGGIIAIPLETWKHIVAGWISEGLERAENWRADSWVEEESEASDTPRVSGPKTSSTTTLLPADALKQIDARSIKIIQARFTLDQESVALEERRDRLVLEMFKSNMKDLLGSFEWELSYVSRTYSIVRAKHQDDDDRLQDNLAKAIRCGHHGSLTVEWGPKKDEYDHINEADFVVSVQDERTELIFGNTNVMIRVIRDLELTVDYSHLEKQVKDVEEELKIFTLETSTLRDLLAATKS